MQTLSMPKEVYQQVEIVARMLADLDAPVEESTARVAPEEDWDFAVDDEVFIGSLIEVKPDPRFYII